MGTTDRWVRRIEQDTHRLRTGSDPTIKRLRELIFQRGVEVGSSLVANLMPEDTDLLSGFLVPDDGNVYEFEFDWRRTQPEQGQLTVWRDVTETYQSRAFRESISTALAMLGHLKATTTA